MTLGLTLSSLTTARLRHLDVLLLLHELAPHLVAHLAVELALHGELVLEVGEVIEDHRKADDERGEGETREGGRRGDGTPGGGVHGEGLNCGRFESTHELKEMKADAYRGTVKSSILLMFSFFIF